MERGIFYIASMKSLLYVVKLCLVCLLLSVILFGCQREIKPVPTPKVLIPLVDQRMLQIKSFPSMKHLTSNHQKNVVIYLTPHADDEVLTFGVPIRNDLARGYQVYVLLLSKGEKSIARDVVNGHFDHQSFHPYMAGQRQRCGFHQKVHIPSAEGYMPLDIESFGNARVREFFHATTALGVPKKNQFVYTLQNGHFGAKELKMIIRDWQKLFPNATFITMSEHDVQRDHAQVAKVVNEEYQQKVIRFKRNYASIATRMHKSWVNQYPKTPLIDQQDQSYILKAIDVYKTWNPEKGFYALGYHSVASQFEYLKKQMNGILLPK